MTPSKLLRPTKGKENYLLIFLLGFVLLFVILLPMLIYNRGCFTYYGDFNSQQIPFYYHSHDLVRNQGIGWDWQTDLGANFIGSYAFYLLGSPFFWLTIPFPTAVVPYLLPYLLCLKHACATLTAYVFLRRFVRSRSAACIGALLYAFSGFQLYNIFFNHFQDVTAFFPLLLIALEERINNNRRGVFALATALMAVINYFFFTGQVVFVIFYFIFRCFCKDFHITLRKFFGIVLESVLGVMLAAGMLLPAALSVMSNSRVDERLEGLNMVLYSDKTRIWRIVQSFFMIPDVPARPNLFSSDNAKWASIGGYLPLFSMVGVCAFCKARRKHWATRLTLLCGFCAIIPILNSMFYTFNASYYARWFYMPILILALMTAIALDDPDISLKPGLSVSTAALLFFLAVSFIPVKDKETEKLQMIANYPVYFYLIWAVCAVSLGIVFFVSRKKERGQPFLNGSLVVTAFACVTCAACVVGFGTLQGAYPHHYRDEGVHGGEKVSLPKRDDQFYRIDIAENYDNFPMFWGYSNMRCFQSVVPSSIMEFYNTLGVTRDVASRADLTHYTLRGLLSVEYYFDRSDDEKQKTDLLPGFTYYDTQNNFQIYHNDAYIPMGFTFDHYVLDTDLEKLSSSNKEQVLIKALLLNEAQVEKYGEYMKPYSLNAFSGTTWEEYLTACKARAAHACDSFTYDSKGFTGHITLDAPNLVFFSVPYEDGWSAEVNGKSVPVERVDYGLMAVPAEAGENEIVFHYETPGRNIGLVLSLVGFVLTGLYFLWGRTQKKKEDAVVMPEPHCYDYRSSTLSIHAAYTEQLLKQAKQAKRKPKIEEVTDASGGTDNQQ